jgi:transposase
MTRFIPFGRDRAFLLPPDATDWLPADDVAHFVAAAVERVPVGAVTVRPIPAGKAQDHPRRLAPLIYACANGILSSRRIARATHRDLGVRHVAANLHPDHDTIATFRRASRAALEAAFLQVLLLARERGLLGLGTVAIDGSKLDADASRIRSVRHDRAEERRAKLAADIAGLTARAEAEPDPQALPAGIARRCARKARLDAACARLEAQARAEAEAARPACEARQAAYAAKTGRRGRPPTPPEDDPPPTRQANLTDPDGAPMRRSDAREYRQAHNAQAVVSAEGWQPILATAGVATPAAAPGFAATILGMAAGIGLPRTVLADAGFASAEAVAALEARNIEPPVAIGRTQPHRPHDFRPPPRPRAARRITEPRRLAMRARPETEDAKARYARRKRTAEPVFGIVKAALGFTRFHLRGFANLAAAWLRPTPDRYVYFAWRPVRFPESRMARIC